MLNTVQLIGYGLYPSVIGDAEGGNADSRTEIDVTLSVFIKNLRSLSPHDG